MRIWDRIWSHGWVFFLFFGVFWVFFFGWAGTKTCGSASYLLRQRLGLQLRSPVQGGSTGIFYFGLMFCEWENHPSLFISMFLHSINKRSPIKIWSLTIVLLFSKSEKLLMQPSVFSAFITALEPRCVFKLSTLSSPSGKMKRIHGKVHPFTRVLPPFLSLCFFKRSISGVLSHFLCYLWITSRRNSASCVPQWLAYCLCTVDYSVDVMKDITYN